MANEDEDEDDRRSSPEIPYQNFGTNVGDSFPQCDREIFEDGEVVRVSPLPKEATETVVSTLRDRGWRVDWHWESSRLVVKALVGFQDRERLREEFDALCYQEKLAIQAEIQRHTKRDARNRPAPAPAPVPPPL